MLVAFGKANDVTRQRIVLSSERADKQRDPNKGRSRRSATETATAKSGTPASGERNKHRSKSRLCQKS
jgi:hypothetical protein